MEFRRFSSPHLPVESGVNALMRQVLLALLPGIAVLYWLYGWGVIINLVLAGTAALFAEGLMLAVRRRPVTATLLDGSALLTGLLLALALPPIAPWWIAVLGSLVAIVIAKQLYGGLGYNPFNPAMIGYIVLLISFPRELSLWPATGIDLGLADAIRLAFSGSLPPGQAFDAITMATPLDTARMRVLMGTALDDSVAVAGSAAAIGWLWINLAFMAGGLWLLLRRVIQWQIPFSMLAGLAAIAMVFHLYDPALYASPLFHLGSGAAMLGAFFIATDPVTACTTPRGRILFGLGIGILTWVIRTFGGYPEGIGFAVLLMNLAAPTIDHYTRPRVFGHAAED